MADDFDLDALIEEATSAPQYADDYVTSTKKEGELVPDGRHDVFVGYVSDFSTTGWGTESVSIVLKMEDSKRGWWVNLDFAQEGDTDQTDKNLNATLKKLLAIGFDKEEAKDIVRNRKTLDWGQLLNGMKINVTVKHNSSGGHTYANTYFNRRNTEASTEQPVTGGTNPMPTGSLPSLG